MKEFLSVIRDHKYYKVFMTGEKPVIVFDDHRFVVPILWLARKTGMIDENINMVRFDGHLDALDFQKDILGEFRAVDSFEAMFRFCEKKLKIEDDDWLSFVLHERIIKNVLTFCDRSDAINPAYADRMFRINRFDGILAHQGEFSQTPILKNHQELWDLVGWSKFGINDAPVLLDIDCDYFTYQWRGEPYPWTDEFYKIEFSNGPSLTAGFSNRSFIDKIIERSPFVTICLEPDFCGGKESAWKILEKLAHCMFDGLLLTGKSG